MFQCQACGSLEFNLMVQPSFQHSIVVETTADDDVLIKAGQQQFIADLAFINKFGACAQCKATKQWQYYYPKAGAEQNP